MYDCRCEFKDGEIKHFIVRISYNRKDDTDLAKELLVMETYAKRGIPTPTIYAFDVQRTMYDFDYVIMEKLEGVPLTNLLENFSIQEKRYVAKSVGELLVKIHSISMDDFGDFTKNGLKKHEEFTFRKLENAPVIHSWTRTLLKDSFTDISGLVALDLITLEQHHDIMRYIYENKKLLLDAKPVLTHGDFHADHILLKKEDDNWIITGIVDFEFASSKAIEYDFIKLHRAGLLDDTDFREGLFEGYGLENVHEKFDALVQFYRILRDIGFAYHLAKAGNKEMFEKVMGNVWKVVTY
jgi:aminoglycoside phosphotransferase (APT) family kinase protein